VRAALPRSLSSSAPKAKKVLRSRRLLGVPVSPNKKALGNAVRYGMVLLATGKLPTLPLGVCCGVS
jgi:hypothetical protein